MDLLQRLSAAVVLYHLDSHSESSRNGTMIRYVGLVSRVVQLVHPRRIPGPPQDTVAPRRQPSLLRRIILVRVRVILVRWSKRDGPLREATEPAAAVELDLAQELIVSQEVRKLPGPD